MIVTSIEDIRLDVFFEKIIIFYPQGFSSCWRC